MKTNGHRLVYTPHSLTHISCTHTHTHTSHTHSLTHTSRTHTHTSRTHSLTHALTHTHTHTHSPDNNADTQKDVDKFFSQKSILPSPWPTAACTSRLPLPAKRVTFSPHPPSTACESGLFSRNCTERVYSQ